MKNNENLSAESLPNEEWRDIVGYEGYYQVSSCGRVRSVDRKIKTGRGYISCHVKGKIMKIKVHRTGYLEVSLSINGKSKTHKVHRLVSAAFIPNPQNHKEVNHKDENKANNNVDNLEWCTSKYNANYGERNRKSALARSKGIVQIDARGIAVAKYDSLTNAGKSVGGNAQGVFLCANNIIKKYKGYIWKYKEDYERSDN
jgi:hypothetical protein